MNKIGSTSEGCKREIFVPERSKKEGRPSKRHDTEKEVSRDDTGGSSNIF
jgi:hypothetical protein